MATTGEIEDATRAAIHMDGLTKYYGKSRGIEDVDLDVREGEVFGFLGPNGAGKTTTIRTLLDEIRPTAGTAAILGLDTHRNAVEIRRHIGYIPGDLALYPNLTGRDTLTYFANMRGGCRLDVCRRAGRTAGIRPLSKGRRPVDRQPSEGRDHPGLYEPAGPAYHGRADVWT